MRRDLLPALDQRFLVDHYGRWQAAEAIADDDSAHSLAVSSYGGAGPQRAWFDTDRRGIHYTMPGEPEPGDQYNERGMCIGIRRAHTITWSRLRRHRLAQPAELVAELVDARAMNSREALRHWKTSRAIAENGYWRATPEQTEQLDAEWERHLAACYPLKDRVWAAVDAILPLAAPEPADLIEWAEQLL